MLTPPYLSPRRHPAFAERDLWNMSSRLDHSGFAPANFTTLPHFSVHEDSVRGPHQGQQSIRTASTDPMKVARQDRLPAPNWRIF